MNYIINTASGAKITFADSEPAALAQIRERIKARRDKLANRAKGLSASLRKLNAFRDAPAPKSRPKTRKGAFLV